MQDNDWRECGSRRKQCERIQNRPGCEIKNSQSALALDCHLLTAKTPLHHSHPATASLPQHQEPSLD